MGSTGDVGDIPDRPVEVKIYEQEVVDHLCLWSMMHLDGVNFG